MPKSSRGAAALPTSNSGRVMSTSTSKRGSVDTIGGHNSNRVVTGSSQVHRVGVVGSTTSKDFMTQTTVENERLRTKVRILQASLAVEKD